MLQAGLLGVLAWEDRGTKGPAKVREYALAFEVLTSKADILNIALESILN